MRDWLNSVMAFIGSTSLTDEEWAAVNVLEMTTLEYNQAAYDQLSEVLVSRESVSTMQVRLAALFTAKGATFTPAALAETNIYLGDVL